MQGPADRSSAELILDDLVEVEVGPGAAVGPGAVLGPPPETEEEEVVAAALEAVDHLVGAFAWPAQPSR